MKWSPIMEFESPLFDLCSVKSKPPVNLNSFQKTQKPLIFLKSKEKSQIIPLILEKVIEIV